MAVPGCALPQPSPATANGVEEEVQQFLDDRARHLAEGNIEAFLASAGPDAMATEGPIATGSTTVPLRDISFQISGTTGLDPGEFKNRRVDLSYSYGGLPEDNTFRIPLEYDITKAADGWVVTRAALQPGGRLPLWASGAVVFERSDHFLALYRPGADNVAQLLDDAERARSQLEQEVPFPLESTYLLLVADDEQQYSEMAGTTLGPISPIAQVETSYEVTPDRIRVVARQLVINRSKLYQSGKTIETLRHELGHFVLAQVTRPFTPAWASEAAAMYLAGTRTVELWQSGAVSGKFGAITIDRLTRASSLGEHADSGENTSLEYAYSAAAGWFLVETYGPEHFWDFYASYADVPAADLYKRLPDPGSSLDDRRSDDSQIADLAIETTHGALDRFFGLTASELDDRIRTWIRGQ